MNISLVTFLPHVTGQHRPSIANGPDNRATNLQTGRPHRGLHADIPTSAPTRLQLVVDAILNFEAFNSEASIAATSNDHISRTTRPISSKFRTVLLRGLLYLRLKFCGHRITRRLRDNLVDGRE